MDPKMGSHSAAVASRTVSPGRHFFVVARGPAHLQEACHEKSTGPGPLCVVCQTARVETPGPRLSPVCRAAKARSETVSWSFSVQQTARGGDPSSLRGPRPTLVLFCGPLGHLPLFRSAAAAMVRLPCCSRPSGTRCRSPRLQGYRCSRRLRLLRHYARHGWLEQQSSPCMALFQCTELFFCHVRLSRHYLPQ